VKRLKKDAPEVFGAIEKIAEERKSSG
jgi:hypothetical protein